MSPFIDRAPSPVSEQAMDEALKKVSEDFKSGTIAKCNEALLKSTGHKAVELTGSGSDSIRLVLQALKGSILLPDQGIWKGTLGLCESLGIKTSFLPTDLGLIDISTLKESVEMINPSALIITSFTGYIAAQEAKAIHRVCREYGVLLIEDASSSIRDDVLADGRYADIILASARSPKILNLPAGGFITSDDHEIMDAIKTLNHFFEPDHVICAGIAEELKHTKTIIQDLNKFSNRLKRGPINLIHKKRRGLCVGIKHAKPRQLGKRAFESGLMTEKGRSLLSICPRYDRFMDKGAVIELKKIDVNKLDEVDLELIYNSFNH